MVKAALFTPNLTMGGAAMWVVSLASSADCRRLQCTGAEGLCLVPRLERHGRFGYLSESRHAGGYDAYSDAMAHFIRDMRKDLNAPRLLFVIGVVGVGGPVEEYGPEQQRYKATHTNFRLAMAAPAELPEFKGTVATVWTEKCWDRELTAAKAKNNEIKQQAKKLATEKKIE